MIAPRGSGLKRLLFSIDARRCPFGCTYCFARFDSYSPTLTLNEVENDLSILEGVDIVYPACDSDLFGRKDYAQVLHRSAALRRSISLSTKALLRDEHLQGLNETKMKLPETAALKVGISISLKHQIAMTEPRASAYAERIASLKRLRRYRIENCLVLRPLLPDVTRDEYYEILDDAEGSTDRVLLGDEWLEGEPTPEELASDGRELRHEAVSWLQGSPLWPKRVDHELHAAVAAYARDLGYRVFESDLDVMADVLASAKDGEISH